MRKRTQPAAGGMADANLANLRNLLAYFRQGPWINSPHAKEGAEAATKAIECLEAGSVQEALSHCLCATSAVSRLGQALAKAMDDTAYVRAIEPHYIREVTREMKRKAGKATQKAKTKAKAEAAIEDARKMINGGANKTDAQRKAAKQHKTSLTTVRRFWL